MPTVQIPSVTGGQVEKFSPGDVTTWSVAGGLTVRGGRIVEATANRTCRESQAASMIAVGFALYDGDPLGVAGRPKITVAHEGVYLVLANGAITAGAKVIADATGGVLVAGAAPDARSVVGVAFEAIANGQTGPVRLRF